VSLSAASSHSFQPGRSCLLTPSHRSTSAASSSRRFQLVGSAASVTPGSFRFSESPSAVGSLESVMADLLRGAVLMVRGISTTIKHAIKRTIKLKTSPGPARLAQLLRPSLAFLPCDAMRCTVLVIVILCPSACLSVCHTRALCPYGSTYDRDFFTIW